MKIEIDLRGAQQARDEFAGIASRMRDLSPAYLRGGSVILTDAQGRIDVQGPGWKPPAMDYGSGTLLHRNGVLYRSLTLGAPNNDMQMLPDGIRVGTNIQRNGVNIARVQQFGSGIFGPSATPIKPTNKKALKFMAGGKAFVVRSVKGVPQRWFLYVNQQTAKKVASVFVQRVRGEI